MPATTKVSIKAPKYHLQRSQDWYPWIQALQDETFLYDYWKYINPDSTVEPIHTTVPEPPSIGSIRTSLQKERAQAIFDQDKQEVEYSTIKISETKVDETHTAALAYYHQIIKNFDEAVKQEYIARDAIIVWIRETVDGDLFHAASQRVHEKLEESSISAPETIPMPPTIYGQYQLPSDEGSKCSYRLIRAVLKELKAILAPNEYNRREDIRDAYKCCLLEAQRGSMPFDTWSNNWHMRYGQAKRYKLPEVESMRGILDFLRAIRVKYHPTWAERELENIFTLEALKGSDSSPRALGIRDLRSYVGRLQANMSNKRRDIASSINAAWGATEDIPQCVCDKGSHPWKPESCRAIEAAFRGRSGPRPKGIKSSEAASIKEKLKKPEWRNLNEAIKRKAWYKCGNTHPSAPPGGFIEVLLDANDSDDMLHY